MVIRRGWTKGELADKLSIDRTELSKYEHGKVTANLYAVVEIAKALKTDLKVDGYRIGPDHAIAALPPVPEQLCIEFGKEHDLGGTSLKIRPTKQAILISGSVQRIRLG